MVDIGSGVGTDTLISANKIGSEGKVYGLDLTRAMQVKLACNIEITGIGHVVVLSGNTEAILLAEASVDVITSNGVSMQMPRRCPHPPERITASRMGEGRVL